MKTFEDCYVAEVRTRPLGLHPLTARQSLGVAAFAINIKTMRSKVELFSTFVQKVL